MKGTEGEMKTLRHKTPGSFCCDGEAWRTGDPWRKGRHTHRCGRPIRRGQRWGGTVHRASSVVRCTFTFWGERTGNITVTFVDGYWFISTVIVSQSEGLHLLTRTTGLDRRLMFCNSDKAINVMAWMNTEARFNTRMLLIYIHRLNNYPLQRSYICAHFVLYLILSSFSGPPFLRLKCDEHYGFWPTHYRASLKASFKLNPN